MKKILSLTLVVLLLLGLVGCTQQGPPMASRPPATEKTGVPETTALPETIVPKPDPTEPTQPTEPSEVTTPTQSTEATEEMEPTQPQKPKGNTGKQEDEMKPADPPATEPTQPATEPTDPLTTRPPQTEPPDKQPTETKPATEPTEPTTESTEPATEPPTQPTETAPSEPVGCQHDWMCIHHDEEGHWRAGIICDCGWTAYDNADDLVSLWNTHSASYPPEESLFEHGGFGCVDEWIVDKPAYDEWVCRHCGEPKP